MAGGQVTGYAKVDLDGKEAGKIIEKLKNQARELENELVELNQQEVLDKKRIREVSKELRAIDGETKKIQRATFSYQEVLDNLSGASLKDLNKAYRKLRAEASGLNRETEEYKLKASQMSRVQAEIGKVRTEMRGAAKQTESFGMKMGRLADKFNRFAAMGLGFIGMLTGIVFSARKAVDAFNEFEEAEANLSALTGLVGNELKELSASAREMATSVDESGVRITQSAVDIENAFTKVGSQRPELLKDADALKAVTKDAMILAEASKGELEPSAIAVTAALNNFDLAATESRRIINVLAAGSKEGAADVSKLTIAFDKAGTTANLLGLSVEDLVGITEAVAPKFNDMNKAGNSLDKVLMIMKDSQIGFTDGIFDMNDALDEVRSKMQEGQTATDLFGREHAKMIEVLLAEQSEIDRYTKAVTGSNVAIEQAIKNTDTNAAKLEQAKNKAQENAMVLGEKLAPALTFSTDAFSYLTKALIAVIENWDTFKKYLITGTVAIGTYTIATKAASIANIDFKDKLDKVKKAMKLFNKAVTSNPLVLFITLLATAGTALYMFRKNTDKAAAAQEAMNDITSEAQKSIAREKTEIERLLLVARDDRISKEKRLEAVEKLNKISPEYLGNISLEKINTDEARKSIDAYVQSLEKKAKIKAAESKLVELEKQIIDVQTKAGEGANFWDEVAAADDPNLTAMEYRMRRFNSQLDELNAKKKTLLGFLNQDSNIIPNSDDSDSGSPTGPNPTPTPSPVGDADEVKQEAEKVLDIISGYNLELIDNAEERDIAELNSWLDKEKKRIESAEGSAEQIAEAKAMLDTQYEQRRSDIEQKYNQERLDRFNEVNDFLKEQQNNLLSDREQIMAREVEAIQKKYDKQIDIARKAMEEDKANREAYLNLIAQLEATKQDEINTYYHDRQMVFDEQQQQARLDVLQKYGINRQEQLDLQHQTELGKLKSLYDEGKLSHKEYNKAKLKVDNDYYKKSLAIAQNAAGGALEIINLVGNFYSEQKNLELEKAGDNEEKKKEIQKKYADKEFRVTAAQIIAKTALGIIQAIAQLGPIAGAIASVIIGTTGNIQLMKAKEQRQKVKGLAKGGKFPVTREQDNRVFEAYYDDPFIRGYVNEPRVLVAEEGPEYVVSNDALQNPQVKTFVDALESSRRNGTIKTFDYERAVSAGRKIKGYAEGGYTDVNTNQIPQDIQGFDSDSLALILSSILTEVKQLRADVNKQKENLRAYITYSEIKEKVGTMDEIIENSRL
jgi:TP901 family phage tail tape measure protein